MTGWCPFEPTEDYPGAVWLVRETHEITLKSELIKKLKHERAIMRNYLESKLENEDWHAVQDAASDLRDIDAKLEILNLYSSE